MSETLAKSFFRQDYANRFVLVLAFLVILQSVLVIFPSAMCQTVDVVSPSALSIDSITPGNGNVTLFWNLGNAGGSTFTALYYSTDAGSTWQLITENPSQTGSVPIATTSNNVALANDTQYSFILSVSTEAFPDNTTNIPSAAKPVTPKAAAPSATAPTYSYGVNGREIKLDIRLGNSGNSTFNKVYYSTNNGVNWADTLLEAGNSLASGSSLEYVITKNSFSNTLLGWDTGYNVKVAARTAASETKLASDADYIRTQTEADPTPIQPGACTGVYTTPGYNAESGGYLDVYYTLPTNLGTGTFNAVYYSINGGEEFVLITQDKNQTSFRIEGLDEFFTVNGLLVVTTSEFTNAKTILNTASFSGSRTTSGPVKAQAPTITSINPGNASLTIHWEPNNPGSGTFLALYWQVDDNAIQQASVPNFDAGSFTITTRDGTIALVNATAYDVKLRITTTAYDDVNVALESNTVNATPVSAPVLPDIPTISSVDSAPYNNGASAEFQFTISLGSNGGSPFTDVFYTTNGTDPSPVYKSLGTTTSGVVVIHEESDTAGEPLEIGTTYNVKIVSQTVAFAYTANTNISSTYEMIFSGGTVEPEAPLLEYVTQNPDGTVSIGFVLGNLGGGECQLWYTTNGSDFLPIPGSESYNPSSPIVVSQDSAGNPFTAGSYVFKLALTNAATTAPESSPQSTEITLTYEVAEFSRNVNELHVKDLILGTNYVPTTLLGNEVCAHNNWKGFQSSSKNIVSALALSLPTLALWRLKVAPKNPLILALVFWILYHAVRDIRDKSVTTDYKFATRFEYFMEHVLYWLVYGCLISAAYSLRS